MNEDVLFSAHLVLPDTHHNYSNPDLPDHFFGPTGEIDNTSLYNQVTDAGATLGRVFFYNKVLLANQPVSCASCHIQTNGFSDPRRLSEDFEDGVTSRNSMGLANVRY